MAGGYSNQGYFYQGYSPYGGSPYSPYGGYFPYYNNMIPFFTNIMPYLPDYLRYISTKQANTVQQPPVQTAFKPQQQPPVQQPPVQQQVQATQPTPPGQWKEDVSPGPGGIRFTGDPNELLKNTLDAGLQNIAMRSQAFRDSGIQANIDRFIANNVGRWGNLTDVFSPKPRI